MDQDPSALLAQLADEAQPGDAQFHDLVQNTARVESTYNPNAVGPPTRNGDRARGLLQIMPPTARDMGVDPATATPEDFARAGVKYLSGNYDFFNKNPVLASAAHHAGRQAVIDAGYQVPGTSDGQSTTAQYVNNVTGGQAQPAGAAPVFQMPTWSAKDAAADFDRQQAAGQQPGAQQPAEPSAPGEWTPQEAAADFDKQFGAPQPPPPPEESAWQTITRQFVDTAKQTAQAGYGLIGLAANAASDMVGDSPTMKAAADSASSWAFGKFKEWGDKVSATARPYDEWSTAYHDMIDNGNFGSMVKWAEGSVGMLGGYITQQAGMALIGGAAASMAAGPEAALPGAVAGMAGKGWLERWLLSKVEATVAKMSLEKAAAGSTEEAIRAAAVKQVGAQFINAGRVAGAGLFNVGTMEGQTYGTARELNNGQPLEGEPLARVSAGGLAAGMINTIGNVAGVHALTEGGIKALSGLSMPARIAGGAAILGAGGAAEMTGMTAASRFGAGQALTGDEASKAYTNAAALGALGGGLVGAAGGLRAPPPEPIPLPEPKTFTPAQDVAAKATAAAGIGDPSVSVEDAITRTNRLIGENSQALADLHQGIGQSLRTTQENLAAMQGPDSPDANMAKAAALAPPGDGLLGKGGVGERMLTNQYLQNIEERQGAALPHEAAHLAAVGAGAPYDKILPAEPLTEPAGARPNGAAPDALVEQLKSVNTPVAGQLLADVRAGRISIEDAQKAADKLTGEGAQQGPAFTKRTQPANPVEDATAKLQAAAAEGAAPPKTPGELLADAAAASRNGQADTGSAAAEPGMIGENAKSLTETGAPGIARPSNPASILKPGDELTNPGNGGRGPYTMKILDHGPTGELPDAKPGDPPDLLTKQKAQLIEELSRRYGENVHFFDKTSGQSSPQGFIRSDRPNEIFINRSAKLPHLAIFGHEFFHNLVRNAPDIAKKFMDVVRSQLTPENQERYKTVYGKLGPDMPKGELNAQHVEEFSADLFGSALTKETFWSKVFDHVGSSTGMGPREVTRLGALVQRAVRTAIAAFGGGRKFTAESMVADFGAIHDAAAQAMKEYGARREIPAREMEMHRMRAAQETARMPMSRREGTGARESPEVKDSEMRGNFEVAPDRSDAKTSAEWDAMSYDEKERASLVTTEQIVPKVLRLMGVTGKLEPQAGGWKGKQNPSFMLRLNDESKLPEVVKTLGRVLRQEAVGVVADHPFEGSSPMHELKITLPHNMDYAQIGKVYDKLQTITPEAKTDAEGNTTQPTSTEPIINGHSTTVGGNDMRVLHDAQSSGVPTAELARRVGETLGPDYKVESRAVHAAFPDTGEANEQQAGNTEQQPRGSATDLLRDEASRLVAREAAASAERRAANAGAEAQTNESRGAVDDRTPEPPEAVQGARPDDAQAPAAPANNGPRGAGERGDTLVGTHYSNKPRTNLAGSYYGSGLGGAERSRLGSAVDERIKNRSYFYINKGKGVFPEMGVGHQAHEAKLDRMYNGSDNPEGIPSKDMNHFESEVLNRGYKGYYTRNNGAQMGTAVRLGEHSNLPIEHVGVGPRAPRNDLPEVQESRATKAEESDEGRAAVAKIFKNLTPQEQHLITTRAHQALIDAFGAVSTNEMAAIAFAGRAKRGWYENATRALGNVFGADAPRFAALLAALSPMRGVKDNLDIAVRIFTAWHLAGRPTDSAAILRIADSEARQAGPGKLMAGYRRNTVTALSHDDPVGAMLSGPKVDSFMRNLAGYTNNVTLDGWMAMYANVNERIFGGRLPKGGDNRVATAGYLGMAARVRDAAAKLTELTGETWTPAEVQETIWSWSKTLYETGAALHMTAADVLKHGILDHDLIASTPDFATLFHTDANDAALRAAGFGKQLDSLKSGGMATGAADEVPGAVGQAAPFAAGTQRAHELAAASRLDDARFGNTAAQRLEAKETTTSRADQLARAEAAVSRTKVYESPDRQEEEDAFKSDTGNHLDTQRKLLDGDRLGWIHDATKYAVGATKEGQAASFDYRDGQFRVGASPALLALRADQVARALYHENMHVADWGGLLYTKHPEFKTELVDGKMTGVGIAAKELMALHGKDPRLTQMLDYPMDAEKFPHLQNPKDFGPELFAQGATINRIPGLQEILRNEAPNAKAFFDAALAHSAEHGHAPGDDFPYELSKLRDSFAAQRSTDGLHQPGAGRDDANPAVLEASSNREMFGDLTPEQEAAMRRVGAIKDNQTLGQRLAKARANFGLRFTQGVLDEFRAIRDVSPVGYMLARLSKGSDGTLESALMFGKPFMNGDTPDVDVKDPTGGFANVMSGLKGEHQRFLQWVAAQRADQLKAQGKENLYTSQDIQDLKTLNQGNFADGTPRAQAYKDALSGLTDYNAAMLDIGRKSGLLSDDLYTLMKDQPYVPFYRAMEDKAGFPLPTSGLTSQYFSKRLSGGDAQLKSDLLDNVVRNWSHILSASAKNRAALRTIDDLQAHNLANSTTPGAGSVRVMRDGMAEHYEIHDPYVAQAMGAINYIAPSYLKPFGVMKRLLTYGITASPIFKVRTLIRETLAATAQSEISNNALGNLAQGWKNTDIRSQIFASTLAGGGQIRFGSMEGGSRLSAMIQRAGGVPLNEGTMGKWLRMGKDVADVYHDLGNRVENVNRTALYEQLIKKGYSHTDANFASRDLLDFTASGRFAVVRFLNGSVPFMNARMQSVYALAKTAQKNPAKVGAVVGGIALGSLALMLTQQDDDWWKQREDFDRDAYWAVKVGDQAYYIPKPFELGAIGTLAERTWELMFNKDMTTRKWGANFGQTLLNTFALDPTPQIVKPAWAVYANKDPFTQRPIESGIDQTMRPQDRFDQNTSSAARLLGDMGIPNPVSLLQANYNPLSPKQIDYLLRGYFGSLATLTTSATDAMLRPMTGEGSLPSWGVDKWSAGFVRPEPSNNSAYVEELYQKAAQVHQAFASMRMARETGDMGRAQEIQQETAPLLAQRGMVDNAEKQLSALNKMARQVEASKTMDSDTKKAMLDQISQKRNAIAARVHNAQQ